MANIAVFHTKMIIGGGERLLIDMTKALQAEGHKVTIYVNEHNKQKCFEETLDGTCDVREVKSRFPESIFGHLSHVCFIIRFLIIVLRVLWTTRVKYDLVIVDEHPFVLPFIRLFRKKTIYYMHYPVKLVAETQRGGSKVIFWFLGLLEELSLLFASAVFVNSNFIQRLYRGYFPVATRLGKVPTVLYPVGNYSAGTANNYDGFPDLPQLKGNRFFLSVNRFCPNKNLEIALDAFARLSNDNVFLVFAGGLASEPKYTDYFRQFNDRIQKSGVGSRVIVLPNIAQKLLLFLYANCSAVLYTPINEHFGIIPIEAQSYGCIVLAQDNGGPLETVGKGSGFNLSNDPEVWAQKMKWVLENDKAVSKMREEGPKHVERNFSFRVFQKGWAETVNRLIRR